MARRFSNTRRQIQRPNIRSLQVIEFNSLPSQARAPGRRARDMSRDDLNGNQRNLHDSRDNTIIISDDETHIFAPTQILNEVLVELGFELAD